MPKPKKGLTGPPWSEAAKFISLLFKRRETTHWSSDEIILFLDLEKRRCFETLEDLRLIDAYYQFERKKEKGIHRRDVITFLRHYGGERDRAHVWADNFPKLAYPASSEAAASRKEQPARWREFILAVYPQANPDFDYWKSPPTLRDEFKAWEKNDRSIRTGD